MVLALKRSAYSTNIKTRSDFSCAFFDAELRSVAQGFAQPVHLGSMVEQVPQAVRATARTGSGPGDVIVTNDPHPSGVHLNDVSLISPVFVDGELLGYVANLAHHVDVGGGAPASIGAFREVFQEGVIIPPVRLVAGGADRRRRLPAHPRPDPLEARDGRRLPGADRRQRDGRAARAGARRPARPGDDPAGRWPSCSSTRSDGRARSSQRLPHGVYEAEGFGRQRRLHRRARAPACTDRARPRRRLLRHERLRPAAARARSTRRRR